MNSVSEIKDQEAMMALDVKQTETIQQLVKVLKAQERWENLITALKDSIRIQLENAETPEQTWRMTQDLKAITRIFAHIEAIAEGRMK